MNFKDKIEGVHRTASSILNTAVNKLSSKTKKWMLGFIGLTAAALCLTLIIRSFSGDADTIQVEFIKVPSSIFHSQPDPLLPQEDRALLTEFKTMMDSLKVYDFNSYSEILKGHEGLLDSVNLILSIRP